MPRRRKPTPREQGLHALSLIVSGDLYEGLRLYCFKQRLKHQHLLRRLLGDFLATKGIVRVVPLGGEDVRYELLKRP